MLTVDAVEKSYPMPQGTAAVLRGVSFTLSGGETLALTGESGSGKSTLLHLVAGLDAIDAGEIQIDGAPLSSLSDAERAALRRERIGLVFQQFNLIPSLTVADNIAFQARLAGRFDAAWRDALIARLRLEGLERRYPEALSGGQQQRVAIGRALAGRPALVLADEPTGNLDAAASRAVLDLMLELVAESGAALLMVTHSADVAGRLARRLHLKEGRLSDASTAPGGADARAGASADAPRAATSP